MEKFVTLQAYNESLEELHIRVELLAHAVQGDVDQLTDGALSMAAKFNKLAHETQHRNLSEHDKRAARHARLAAREYYRQANMYIDGLLDDTNQFLRAFPDHFRAVHLDSQQDIALRSLYAVGRREAIQFATLNGDEPVIFTSGDYDLRIKSSIMDSE